MEGLFSPTTNVPRPDLVSVRNMSRVCKNDGFPDRQAFRSRTNAPAALVCLKLTNPPSARFSQSFCLFYERLPTATPPTDKKVRRDTTPRRWQTQLRQFD